MKKIIIDPEFKELVPKLKPVEYEKLEKLILKHGFTTHLTLWRNILLDGHHRYKICKQHKIEFQTRDIKLKDRNAARIWMLENQLGRRNLTAFQRIELVVRLEDCQKYDRSIGTKREMATQADVSHDTYYRAKKIIAKASEEDKELLRRGEATINEIFQKISAEEKERTVDSFQRRTEADFRQGDFADISADFGDSTYAPNGSNGAKDNAVQRADKHKRLFKDRWDAFYIFTVLLELSKNLNEVDLTALSDEQRSTMLEALVPAQEAIASAVKSLEQEAALQ